MRHIKRLGLFGVALFAALGVGVAFAAWTATGSGNGYAKAKTAIDLSTVDISATTTGQLYPSGTGDVLVRIKNDNDYGIDVTSINGNGAITSDKGAACNGATGVTYTNQAGTWHVAGHASQTVTLTGAASMSNASDNACQGAIFTIPVLLSGTSNP